MPTLVANPVAPPNRTPLWVHLAYAAAAAGMMTFAPQNLPPATATLIRGLPLLILAAATLGPLLKGDRRAERVLVGLGFLASLIGDTVIPFEFLAGIGAFLAAHVLYLAAMGLPRQRLAVQGLALVPAGALWIVMFGVLAPRVPTELFVPVVAYLTVITLFLARALGRVFAVPRERSHVWMLVGAMLFVSSDGLLAINRWVTPLPQPHLWVLGTYLLAQWCIWRAVEQ